MRATPLILSLAAGAAIATAARAQTQAPQAEGPVIVGENKPKWKLLELGRVDAALDLVGQYRNDRLSSTSGSASTRDTLFRESLELSTTASIGHKNLIDLSASGKLELDQRSIHSDLAGQDANEQDYLGAYDIRALILGSGPAPVTVYSKRDQNTIDRGFGSRIDQTVNENGAILQLQSQVAPTTLQYFHRSQDLQDSFAFANSHTTQDTFTAQSNLHLTTHQRLDLNYTFDAINEEQPGLFQDSFNRHDANIVHTLAFSGDTPTNELRSSLRLYSQSGDFAQDNLRWDELLTLQHTPRLDTRYHAIFDRQSRDGLDQELYRGEATIRHRLFDSLTSTATAGAQRLVAPLNFTSNELFASGQLDYTKKVVLGRLDASLGLSVNNQDNSARGGILPVTNQAATASSLQPIVIPRGNVVSGSLVLLPSAGGLPFREGIDYTVTYFPDRVEISIPPGSAITDGQSVFASYDIGPEPGSQIDTLGTSASARYSLTQGTLRGLATYITYRTVDHSLQSSNPTSFVLDDFQNLLVGVEYTRDGLDLRVEQEKRWSNIAPFDRFRALAQYNQTLGRDSSLGLDLSHETIDYSLQNNRSDIDRATARWNHRLSDSLAFKARLDYRDQRDRLSGNTQAFEQSLELTWTRAQTTIYGSVQNSFINGPSTDRTSQFLQIGIRRTF